LILKKIIKILATRCQILRLKCNKFDFDWGSASDPAGGAYGAPPDTCAPNKTCQLDPVPTWLVKDMSNLLSPFIALLVNKSLVTGCFPAKFKEAIIQPLLKREGLDLSDLKNCRPVYNLPFLSKLLERVVQARLLAHLDGNCLLPS